MKISAAKIAVTFTFLLTSAILALEPDSLTVSPQTPPSPTMSLSLTTLPDTPTLLWPHLNICSLMII